MNVLRLLLVLCVGILLWITCTTEENERAPLSDAINIVDDNPKEALALLEGIIPDPKHGQDQYWQYIVILTQARYMDYQDITGDSLILDAQRYFAKTHNYEMAARASYYAAFYWYEEEAGDKAVEYWQTAFSFAEWADNNLFKIKSTYGLSRSYFNQEQWEDAMLYCQKALNLYDDKLDAGYYKLDVINMLGHIYLELKNQEQAYLYFDKGLNAAKKLNNVKYESRFLRQIGNTYRDKGEYREAKEYLSLALSSQPESEDKLRIYLSYAKLYEAMNCPDSALHYLRLIEGQIPGITHPNTRRDIYKELATYYQTNVGDANKVALYSDLAHKEDVQIKKSQTDKKIEALLQKYEQIKQKKETEGKIYSRIFDYGIIVVLILVSLLVIVQFNKLKLKDRYIQIRQKLLSRTIDQEHFLLAGLRSVAKGTDDLQEKELAYAGSPAWEQLNVLREEFCLQIAERARQEMERLPNGKKALSKLALDDLPIIHLSQRSLPNEYIGWALGHQGNKEKYIMHRKEQIRWIMAEAEMRDGDISMLVP